MNDLVKPTFGSSGLALFIFFGSIVVYGWQVHGLWTGIGLGALFLVLVFAGNFVGLTVFKSFKFGTFFRWAVFVVSMFGIGLSGAEVCDTDGQCSSLL